MTQHTSTILKGWNDTHSAQFQSEIMTFRHNLNKTGLFTDEALIELLKKHPATSLDVCSMGDSQHELYPNQFRTGDFRDASPETLLAAAKAGRIWMNLRRAMNIHPEYKRVLDMMYGEIANHTGMEAFKPNGGILISSPISQTPYHFDKTETVLWHVRGKKRVYVYPLTQEFISDKDYEDTITNALKDDLPYQKSYDKDAVIIDLEEDQAATWPLNSPHRVDNSEFCVSVTTEYSTRASAFKNAGMIANATLRKKFGMSPNWTFESQMSRYVKFALGKALKVTKTNVDVTKPDMVTFRLDPKAPGYVVDVDPYERTF